MSHFLYINYNYNNVQHCTIVIIIPSFLQKEKDRDIERQREIERE